MMSEILHLHFWQPPFYRFISTISQESRDFRMYSIWHTGDMQYPLQPCLRHYKKPVFTIALGIGTIASVALGFAKYWLAFLVVFVIAKVGYSVTLVFYDSMLVDVTSEDRMDEVSSQGYAWGYIGSCVPFVICLLVVLNAGKIGITMETAMMVSFVIITVWWVIMTLPLLKTYHQKYYVEKKQHAFSESFKRIGITLKNVKKEKKI